MRRPCPVTSPGHDARRYRVWEPDFAGRLRDIVRTEGGLVGSPLDFIENARVLDAVARPGSALVSRLFRDARVKDAASGRRLGHPVHPLLTDLPTGFWTGSLLLDVTGGRKGRKAAERLIALGILSAVPTALTGLSDWADTAGPAKRVGIVHAIGNGTALVLYARSYLARKRGRHLQGMAFSTLAAAAMGASGYLGGHLAYRMGIGVDQTLFDDVPREWTAVLSEAELPAGVPKVVQAGQATVLVYRTGQEVCAIADRCSHRGGPLHEGEIDTGRLTVTCPWHASQFSLRTGEVLKGPATAPQPCYDSRITAGQVEIKLR